MSDKITVARDFLRSYLEKNNTGLGEHSAVMALVEYLEENGGSVSEVIPVTETEQYKELLEKYNEIGVKFEEYVTKIGNDSIQLVEYQDKFLAYENSLVERKQEHEVDIKQRDYNWSELQKAKAKITELEAEIVTLKEVPSVETSTPEETKEAGKPGRPKKTA